MKISTLHISPRFIYLLVLFGTLSAPYRFYGLNLPAISSFSIIEPILAVGGVYVLLKVMISRKLLIGPRLIFYVLSLPLILSIISISWSKAPFFTINEMAVNIECLASYLVVLNLGFYFDRRSLLLILLTFSISLLVVSLASYPPLSIFQPQLPGNGLMTEGAKAPFLLSYNARLSHPFIGLSNNYATILAMIFPVVFSVGKALPSKFWLFLSSLLFGAIIATLSRGVLLALASSFLFVLLFKTISNFALKKNSIKYFVFIILGSILLAGFVYYVAPEMANHLLDRLDSRGAIARLGLALDAFRAISKHPLLGYGGGVSFYSDFTGGLTDIHNTFLQRFYWYGIPLGLISVLSMSSLPLIFKHVLCKDNFAQNLKEGVFIALLCQIFIMFVESSWEGSVLRIIMYAFLGLITTLIFSSPSVKVRKICQC